MSNIIKVSCPGCNTVFEVPPELAGQVGECTECGSTFMIPQPQYVETPPPASEPAPEPEPQEAPEQQEQAQEYTNTDTSAAPSMAKTAMGIELDDEDGEPTNTVKLSRSSIGMMPDVDDNFSVDVVNKDSSQDPTERMEAVDTPPQTKKKSPKKTFSNVKPKKKFEPRKPKKKWWQFWK